MSLIELDIDTTDVQKELDRLTKQTSEAGLTEFQETRVAPWIAQRMIDRFNSEGDDASGPWADLLVATQAIRRRGGFGPAHPINVRTGELLIYAAKTHQVETLKSGVTLSQPAKGGPRTAQTKLNHAQRGGVARPGGPVYPARPVAALSGHDAAEIQTRLMRWIIEGGP